MNSVSLDFTPHIDDEEKKYTQTSLDPIVDEVLSIIDIVELAVAKLKIKVDTLPKDSTERQVYISSQVYIADCPRCHEKGELRLFHEKQTFGCLRCYWEGEHSENMNALGLLEHCGIIEGDNDPELFAQRALSKLFEFFPKELAHLAGRDLNQYRYGWDYFAEADKYYPGIEGDCKDLALRIQRGKSRVSDFPEHLKREYIQSLEPLRRDYDRLHCIIKSHEIVSKIYAHQEAVDGILIGKSLEEILGYPIIDEYSEGNMELHALAQEEGDTNNDILESITQDLELEEKRKAEQKQAEQAAENDRIEALRLAEEQRLQKLADTKKENVKSLYIEMLESSNKQQEFFTSCSYDTILEGDVPLVESDFGKLVVVFDKGTSTFSVIIGKQKVQSVPPPKSIIDANIITRTDKMPKEPGLFHENIKVSEGTAYIGKTPYKVSLERLGGAQYILLPDSTILIGGHSGKYGSVCQEVITKCLNGNGFTVVFLNNTDYKTLAYIYDCIFKK